MLCGALKAYYAEHPRELVAGLPGEAALYELYEYISGLGFGSKPDYGHIAALWAAALSDAEAAGADMAREHVWYPRPSMSMREAVLHYTSASKPPTLASSSSSQRTQQQPSPPAGGVEAAAAAVNGSPPPVTIDVTAVDAAVSSVPDLFSMSHEDRRAIIAATMGAITPTGAAAASVSTSAAAAAAAVGAGTGSNEEGSDMVWSAGGASAAAAASSVSPSMFDLSDTPLTCDCVLESRGECSESTNSMHRLCVGEGG